MKDKNDLFPERYGKYVTVDNVKMSSRIKRATRLAILIEEALEALEALEAREKEEGRK